MLSINKAKMPFCMIVHFTDTVRMLCGMLSKMLPSQSLMFMINAAFREKSCFLLAILTFVCLHFTWRCSKMERCILIESQWWLLWKFWESFCTGLVCCFNYVLISEFPNRLEQDLGKSLCNCYWMEKEEFSPGFLITKSTIDYNVTWSIKAYFSICHSFWAVIVKYIFL